MLLTLMSIGVLLAPASLPNAVVLRRNAAIDEAGLLAALIAELRAGRSLRQALIDVLRLLPGHAAEVPMRRLLAGRPLTDVVPGVEPLLPATGRSVGAAIVMAAHTGGAVAALFDRIAAHERDRLALEREHRAATAQIRFSAGVVGGMPLAVTTVLLVTGRLTPVLGSGTFGATVIVVGVALQVSGLAMIAWLMRGAT